MRANSNKEHPKEASNNPPKECLPNKELVLEANSKGCMPPHYRESTANKSNPKERTRVAKSRSNTASAPMRHIEIPTLVQDQDQGCGWERVSIKVHYLLLPLPMLTPSLEEEGSWGNP